MTFRQRTIDNDISTIQPSALDISRSLASSNAKLLAEPLIIKDMANADHHLWNDATTIVCQLYDAERGFAKAAKQIREPEECYNFIKIYLTEAFQST
uniref:Uncharacterized protein n=1 Tax=Globodera rostochiensis TaxID=31243 RepID=A0A914GXQ5_GLORO